MASHQIQSAIIPVCVSSEDKENVDPHGSARLRDVSLLLTVENTASISQLYSTVNAKVNLIKGGRPNPEPSPTMSRRCRHPLQDITAIIYPGQVETHAGVRNGSNPPRSSSSFDNPTHQRATLRPHETRNEASVLFPKKQAVINAKVKKHSRKSGLDIQDRTEKSLQDSIGGGPGMNNVNKFPKDRAAGGPRRHLKLRKLKVKGYFPM